MKTGEEAVYMLIDRMNEIGIDYMIVGSFSSNAYGLARATKEPDSGWSSRTCASCTSRVSAASWSA